MRRFASSRRWALVIGLLAMLTLAGDFLGSLDVFGPANPLGSSSAVAQEDPAADPATETEGDAAATADGEKKPPAPQNFLVWFIGALGWRYTLAFSFVSFTFVAVLVMNILSARKDSVCPQHLADAFDAHLNEKRFQEAFDLAKADESILGQMLAAGMAKLQQGYDKSLEAMGQVGEEESMKMEHRLSYISLVGSLSPMLGLLGTVDGMVASFMVIAQSDTTPKPSSLAAGVSTALITTLVGLVLAMPAIVAFALLKNRQAKLFMLVGQTAGNLFARFEGMNQKK